MSIESSGSRSLPTAEHPPAPVVVAEAYDAFSRRCWSLAKHILGSDDRAQAVVYDVFVELSADPVLASDRDTLSTWLTMRTHRKAVAAVRRDNPSVGSPSGWATVNGRSEQEPDAGDAPPAVVARLEGMPATQRTALLLGYLGGYTASQIARRTRSTVGDVQRDMSLGLQALRAAM